MKVGVGIPTYNRLGLLKSAIASLEQFADVPYDLFVAIDGSTDGTSEWIKARYEHCLKPRQGVAHAKNAILKRFRDYDYVFIMEDDVQILRRGVFSLYLKAMKAFNIQHFNFLAPTMRSGSEMETRRGITVLYSGILGGCFSTYTREVIEKVGAFNPAFNGYGYGHCEHTLRISRAGLTSPWGRFAHVVNAEPYLIHASPVTVSTREEKEKQLHRNEAIMAQSMRDETLVRIPL